MSRHRVTVASPTCIVPQIGRTLPDRRYFSIRDLLRHFVDSHLRNELEEEYDAFMADLKCLSCHREFPKRQALLRHVVYQHTDSEAFEETVRDKVVQGCKDP